MSSVLSGEQLVHLQAKTNYELPSSGLKEFEPSNSWLEQKQIQSALDERKALLEGERVEKWNLMMEAEWIPEKHKAEVKRKNKHWEVFGHHSEGKDWLFPEEVLYLMEMNCLECNFGEVSLSIQKGYSLLLRQESGCSATEYRVYSHLSRAGYRVMRHLPDLTVTAYELQIRLDQHLDEKKTYNEAISTEQIILRPDLPPKKIIDLSNNAEVFIKANCSSSGQMEESNIGKSYVSVIPPGKSPLKPTIEFIDLADSSSEESCDESSDSDIEIIEEFPVSRINDKITNVTEKGRKDDESQDDDILEVTVPKKEIIVTTIESSDSEQEDDVDESESDKSYDGNWKRRHPGKRKTHFVRPTSMSNLMFLAVEEFCLDRSMKIEKDVQNVNTVINCENVESEGIDSSNSVEFISLQPRRARPTFPVSKSRTEILDMIPTMAKQKIMSFESPDLRLLPDTIRPNKQLYTYNTNSLRARVFSSFRGYRGRRNFHPPVLNNYNPFYNNNVFNSSHLTNRPSLLPNSALTQMFGSDVQSVARGMMQFATALLGSGGLPQINQTNGLMPFNYQSRSQLNSPQINQTNSLMPFNYQSSSQLNSPRYSPSGFSSQSMYNEPSRTFSTRTHSRFSDSPVALLTKNDNVQQPFQNTRIGSQEERRREFDNEEYNQSKFFPNSGRQRERNINHFNRSRIPFSRSKAFRSRGFTPRREFRGVNTGEQIVDPAYVRPDVPVKVESNSEENFIPISKNNTKSTEVIDIVDDDENFVPQRGISRRFMKRKKRRTRWLVKKVQKLEKTESEKGENTIIFLDSPTTSSPSSDIGIPNVRVKSETVQSEVHAVNVKEEKITEPLQPVLEMDIKNVKVEEVGVKIEGNINVGEIKKECSIEAIVKTEPIGSGKELLVKTEPLVGNENLDREVEASHVITTDEMPSTSAAISSSNSNDCDQIKNELVINEECDSMEVNDSSENPLLNNVAIEIDSRDLSIATENMCIDLEENVVRIETETKVLSNTSKIKDLRSELKKAVDTSDKVKNWAEMKKHNVHLERSTEISDEEESSADEVGDEIQPLLRPKHCKTIGTVLSALQIFSPFTPKVPEDVPKLKISFDMYLATDFRKAQRGLPHYRIVVFGGMEPMPSEAQLYELRTRFEDTVPMLQAVVMPNSVVYYNCSSVSLPVDDKSYKN